MQIVVQHLCGCVDCTGPFTYLTWVEDGECSWELTKQAVLVIGAVGSMRHKRAGIPIIA